VLVVEVLDGATVTLGALDRDIRARVGRALGVPLADLVFVRRGRIPKTTSGKVQRRELRRRYLAHEIERLALDEGPA
jgi:acyl-coenzyme A synthetase/AMP-(fatty) acid ligase